MAETNRRPLLSPAGGRRAGRSAGDAPRRPTWQRIIMEGAESCDEDAARCWGVGDERRERSSGDTRGGRVGSECEVMREAGLLLPKLRDRSLWGKAARGQSGNGHDGYTSLASGKHSIKVWISARRYKHTRRALLPSKNCCKEPKNDAVFGRGGF
uniref:Uncharacterized protein n=1 Tax=Oryza barthii TaxID=65489 RepID=A0A0D3FVL1_9ORYZ